MPMARCKVLGLIVVALLLSAALSCSAFATSAEPGKDPQLDHALELLKSWQVFKTFVARREG